MNDDGITEVTLAVEYTAYRGTGPNEEGSDYLIDLKGTIRGLRDSGEASIKIGTIDLIIIRVTECVDDEFPLHTMFDTRQETLDAGSVAYDLAADEHDYAPAVMRIFPNLEIMPCQDILLIHRIEIEPSFRGKKIALAVIHQAIKDWSSGCSLILIKPFPLQFEASNLRKREKKRDPKAEAAATKKLKNYYQVLGFKSIPKTAFLAMCPIMKYPTFEELGLPKYLAVKSRTCFQNQKD